MTGIFCYMLFVEGLFKSEIRNKQNNFKNIYSLVLLLMKIWKRKKLLRYGVITDIIKLMSMSG